MAWSINEVGSQSGRIAIVTGANVGLGYDTALALASKDCTVVLACRNLDKGKAAKARILAAHPRANVQCMALDLSSLKSVKSFTQKFNANYAQLDLLINNAGIMTPPFSLSEDGFESQLSANYLGHFALTAQLIKKLVGTEGSRIVSLSSLAHSFGRIRLDDPHFKLGYDKRAAYGQSKLACLMFAYELNRRLKASGRATLSVAAHPGFAATNLDQHLPLILGFLFPMMGQSAAAGCLPTLYAALGADIQGGDYCGPNGLGQMRGKPVKVGSNRASRDQAVAARLWELSEEMTGVKFQI